MRIALNSRRLIAALAILVSACGPGLAEDANGEEIYSVSCARCHGGDLTGGGVIPPLGPGSEAAEKDDAALVQTITRGRGRMPSFESQLSEEQIARVLVYLRDQQSD